MRRIELKEIPVLRYDDETESYVPQKMMKSDSVGKPVIGPDGQPVIVDEVLKVRTKLLSIIRTTPPDGGFTPEGEILAEEIAAKLIAAKSGGEVILEDEQWKTLNARVKAYRHPTANAAIIEMRALVDKAEVANIPVADKKPEAATQELPQNEDEPQVSAKVA